MGSYRERAIHIIAATIDSPDGYVGASLEANRIAERAVANLERAECDLCEGTGYHPAGSLDPHDASFGLKCPVCKDDRSPS